LSALLCNRLPLSNHSSPYPRSPASALQLAGAAYHRYRVHRSELPVTLSHTQHSCTSKVHPVWPSTVPVGPVIGCGILTRNSSAVKAAMAVQRKPHTSPSALSTTRRPGGLESAGNTLQHSDERHRFTNWTPSPFPDWGRCGGSPWLAAGLPCSKDPQPWPVPFGSLPRSLGCLPTFLVTLLVFGCRRRLCCECLLCCWLFPCLSPAG
jgi:hypothetical protein